MNLMTRDLQPVVPSPESLKTLDSRHVTSPAAPHILTRCSCPFLRADSSSSTTAASSTWAECAISPLQYPAFCFGMKTASTCFWVCGSTVWTTLCPSPFSVGWPKSYDHAGSKRLFWNLRNIYYTVLLLASKRNSNQILNSQVQFSLFVCLSAPPECRLATLQRFPSWLPLCSMSRSLSRYVSAFSVADDQLQSFLASLPNEVCELGDKQLIGWKQWMHWYHELWTRHLQPLLSSLSLMCSKI